MSSTLKHQTFIKKIVNVLFIFLNYYKYLQLMRNLVFNTVKCLQIIQKGKYIYKTICQEKAIF